MVPANLDETWKAVAGEFGSRTDRLIAGITSAWEDLHSLIQTADEAFRAVESLEFQPGAVDSVQRLFDDAGKRLLIDPLSLYQKKRPLLRVLSAIQDYESGLEDLARQLPLTTTVSGRELVELVGSTAGASWRKHWLRWQRFSRDIPLRGVALDHVQRQALRRAALDGAFQLALAQSAFHLLGPWQMYRRQTLMVLADAKVEREALETEWQAWTAVSGQHAKRAARLLESYRNWASSGPARLAKAVLAKSTESSPRTRSKRSEEHQRHLSYWSRQQRAVLSVLDLELQLSRLACDAAQETLTSLQSLQLEHDQLLQELDSVIEWLETWPHAEAPDSFPPPQARLVSAEERVAEWSQRVSRCARPRLPATVEAIEPRRALPGWRSPWRELEPARIFAKTLEGTGQPISLEGFREAEASHRAVVRQIERAREVVAFGVETSKSEGPLLAQEAVSNALSLLQYQKRTVREARPSAERSAVRAQTVLFLECHLGLEKGRVGLLAHLTRQRGLRALQQTRELMLHGLRMAFRKAWQAAQRFYQWLLLKIGWLTPSRPQLEPVTRRAHLSQILELELHIRDLPAIYRRLFRLAPVEDPRFLVGREGELAGLAEALSQWQSGLGGSALVIGARGSGKTSLLNCAVSSVFSGVTVMRGQFCERVTNPAQMQGFLQRLFRLPEGSDVITALAGERRVVMIEEFERTFLRVINGFGALRELLDLMYATSGSTLWILSINETAFRYLHAVVGLGQNFSHRINAMSVKQSDLANAILQRHNLSGLRLEFAPLAGEDPRVSKLRRFVGLEQDAQQLFFDALYEQSEGLIRSAFELWQGCIERVEGGVVHMRQPLAPDHRPLLSELTLEDCFILQAILQHGGLTTDEVAQVTGLNVESSGRRLERLRSLEILEPEPTCPGLRVRPEAGRFVRHALHRLNLLQGDR